MTDLQYLDGRSGCENIVLFVSAVHFPPWCFPVAVSLGIVQPSGVDTSAPHEFMKMFLRHKGSSWVKLLIPPSLLRIV